MLCWTHCMWLATWLCFSVLSYTCLCMYIHCFVHVQMRCLNMWTHDCVIACTQEFVALQYGLCMSIDGVHKFHNIAMLKFMQCHTMGVIHMWTKWCHLYLHKPIMICIDRMYLHRSINMLIWLHALHYVLRNEYTWHTCTHNYVFHDLIPIIVMHECVSVQLNRLNLMLLKAMTHIWFGFGMWSDVACTWRHVWDWFGFVWICM